jgi:deoxycytidylate deaminase
MKHLIELDEIFDGILNYAERNQICLRKAVGCAAITFDEIDLSPRVLALVHNGPSREGHPCTNEVGNCGCSHSEPRLVQKVFKEGIFEVRPLVMVCTYSPCTNCANITIDSRLFDGIFYDILTEHDKRGEKFLRQAMPVITRQSVQQVIKTRETGRIDDQIKKWILSSKS